MLKAAATALIVFSAAAVSAQGRREPAPDVPAEKFYKNIQVLKGIPSTELMPAMKFMADSLGVKCSYCHVTNDTGRWPVERDDKPAKSRAREMIRMMREINRANFKGRVEVTCATCHRGATAPAPLPPLAAEPASAHSSPAGPAAGPSVDALLEKYLAAVGGQEAVAKISSRSMRGVFKAADGESHPIEVTQTASGKYRSSVSVPEGSFTLVFDGKSGSSRGPTWSNPMQPDEVARIRSRARLFPASDLRSRFSSLTVDGREVVGGRDAWRVRARNADGERETFWFDAESGLLLRTLERQRTPLGDIPEQADYADYRELDGVKVPFTIRHTAPDRTDTVAAEEVRQNVPVDEKVFSPAGP